MTDLVPSDVEEIRQLLGLVTDYQLAELIVTLREGVVVRIKSASANAAPAAQPHPAAATPAAPAAGAGPLAEPAATPAALALDAPRGLAVAAPMVGIFYRSPAPGEAEFVKPGDVVRVGQTIGLIEAMKVYSEVPSDLSGRVIEVAAANSELVQLGQALLYVEPV